MAWPVTAQTTDPALRKEFAKRLENAERRLPDASPDTQALRNYALYPYLQAARLRAGIDGAQGQTDADVAGFLGQHGDALWTRDLRRRWLTDLADRHQWPLFLQHYDAQRANDALRCHRLSALIATRPDVDLRSELQAVWRSGKQLPKACIPPFDWMKAQGWRGAEETALRARLALENGETGLADWLIRALPQPQYTHLKLWLSTLKNPAQHLPSAVKAGLEPQIIFAAFARLARQSTHSASQTLRSIEAICGQPCTLQSPATPGELRREIALNLSWSRKPEALRLFRQIPLAALDERGHEWRIRAALWAGDIDTKTIGLKYIICS
ncbi:MAG: hypothetical protein ACPGZP_10055 [Panacagrimonas sp.]